MSNPQLELADVVRRFMGPYQDQFGECMLPSHHRALQDIAQCMTEAMGGEHYHCQACHASFWIYHGCRNRSCPKCHGRQISAWLKARSVEILPCRYFHLIATVPSQLRSLFLRHQKILYGLLMKITAETVRDLAAQKRFVGAEVGILAVLHTWTGQLHHHPHVHMLVTGGGVTADGTAWHDAPKDFLVPVRKLSPMIAKRFAAALEKTHPELFAQIPADVWRRQWCSYCKPYGKGPGCGPELPGPLRLSRGADESSAGGHGRHPRDLSVQGPENGPMADRTAGRRSVLTAVSLSCTAQRLPQGTVLRSLASLQTGPSSPGTSAAGIDHGRCRSASPDVHGGYCGRGARARATGTARPRRPMPSVWQRQPMPDRYAQPEGSDAWQISHGQAVKKWLAACPAIHPESKVA